jgi:hypothetical protein
MWRVAFDRTSASDSRTRQFTDAGARPEQSRIVEAHAFNPDALAPSGAERRYNTLRRRTAEINST